MGSSSRRSPASVRPAQDPHRSSPHPVPESRRASVLVTEDDPLVASAIQAFLMIEGYDVQIAKDGGEAIRMLAHAEPDVLLTDIGLPDVDGFAVARAARERYPNIPVLMMTGRPSVATATAALEVGASRHISKPLQCAELVLAIESAVAERLRAKQRDAAFDLQRLLGVEKRKTADLQIALDDVFGSFWMAYQPIVRASTGGLFACEALLRSSDPRLPTPLAVLDAAEKLHEIHALGRIVRERAAAPFLAAQVGTVLFVNLHSRDLLDDALFAPDAPLSAMAHRVVLEITERAPLTDIDDLARRIADLRAMGFRLAIDDLGAGYAAMWALTVMEPEIVKIDMSLVRGVDQNPTKRSIVQHLVAMSHDSGALVVAEGVETEAERLALVSLECDFLQGYLLGRPVKALPWE